MPEDAMTLNRAEIDDRILGNAKLNGPVQQARTILKRVTGSAYPRTREEWFVIAENEGKPVVRIALSDPLGRATAPFSSDEIRDPEYVEDRLRSLWLHVLLEGSHKLAKRLLESEPRAETAGS